MTERKYFSRKKWETALFCIAVFLVMLVFFTVLHPIPIMDEDDVIYSVMVRKAIPLPGKWNPSRMMPEVLSALCGHFAALCTAIGLGRFIDCQVTVLAVMLSGFITVYVYVFFCLLEVRFHIGRFQAFCLSVLFLLLHFLIFRTEESGNKHMFHTYDECCVFYYTISALTGCILVMHFMREPDGVPVLFSHHPVKESFLLLALYFALFSNLFGSAILAAYAAFRVLECILRILKNRRLLQEGKQEKDKKTGRVFHKQFWKENAFWIGILFVWGLAVILELTGGRASGARGSLSSGELSVPAKFGQTVSLFCRSILNSNLLFRLMLGAVLVAVLLLALIRSKRNNNPCLSALGEIVALGVLTSLPVLLLCAGVDPTYAERPETVFPIVFTLFLLLILGMCAVMRSTPFLGRMLPLLLVFVFSMTNTQMRTFCDSNPLLIDGHVAVEIENEMYESIITAAEAGETETTIDVIHSAFGANWPHDGLVGDPIAQLFYKYGIIDHRITVRTNPSDELNARYLLPVP